MTSAQAARLAGELAECRQRGLGRLDVDTPPQSPVRAEVLERLAGDYCAQVAPQLHGRIPCIKRLLTDALDAYSTRGNLADAQLITALFFGDPTNPATPSAGELLKQAMKKRGVVDEKKFREDRRLAFATFAQFLLVFTSGSVSPRRRRVVLVAALGCVLLTAISIAVWALVPDLHTATPVGASGTTDPANGMAPSPVLTTVSSPSFVPGQTFIQTVHTPQGARTYTDPYNLLGEGPRVDNHTSVHVSCKIVAPGVPSVGIYWYRIADPPWNDRYYSPANSWLNGDSIGGPYESIVDATVPYCPT